MSIQERLTRIVDGVVAFSLFVSSYEEIKEPDWGSFFTILSGVGIFFSFVSLGGITLSWLLAHLLTLEKNPFNTAFDVMGFLPYVAVLLYVSGPFLAKAVKSAVRSEAPFQRDIEVLVGNTERFQPSPFSVYVINVLMLTVIIAILLVYRNSLIISEIPAGITGPSILSWILIASLDCGYFGLLLATLGHSYNTIEALRRVGKEKTELGA